MAINLPEIGQVDWGGELNSALTQLDAQTVVDVDREGDNLVFVKNNGEREDLGDFRGPAGPGGPAGPPGPPGPGVDPETLPFVNIEDYGAALDGVTNDAAAILSAIESNPGSTVTAPSGAIIGLAGLNISGQDAILDFSSNTIVQTGNQTPITVTGTWGDSKAATISDPNTVTVSSTSGISVGDVVKVFSDDVIPGTRPGSTPGAGGRLGAFHIVAAVSGSAITLNPPLDDPYTTNVRVAKLNGSRASIRVREMYCPEEVQSSYTTSMIQLRSIAYGSVEARITRGGGAGVALYSCFGCTIHADVSNLLNQPGTHNGYGVSVTASSFNRISGSATNVRHGFTDGPGTGGATPESFGRSEGNLVTMQVIGTTNAALDTHHGSRRNVFSGCVVSSAGTGISLRGEDHVVSSPAILNCGVGINCFFEAAYPTAASLGHYVSDPKMENVRVAYTITQSPTADIISTPSRPNVTISGGLHRFREHIITSSRAQVRMTGHPRFVSLSSVGPETKYFSNWFGGGLFGSIDVDLSSINSSPNESNSWIGIFNSGSALWTSILEARVHWGDYLYQNTCPVISASNARIDLEVISTGSGQNIDKVILSPPGNDAAARKYSHINKSNPGRDSSAVRDSRSGGVFSLGNISNNALFRIDVGSGASFSGIEPGARYGQRITVLNSSTSSGNLTITSPGATTLAPNESADFFWDGISSVWRRV